MQTRGVRPTQRWRVGGTLVSKTGEAAGDSRFESWVPRCPRGGEMRLKPCTKAVSASLSGGGSCASPWPFAR